MKHKHADLMACLVLHRMHKPPTSRGSCGSAECPRRHTSPKIPLTPNGCWYTLKSDPAWNSGARIQTQAAVQHTVTLNTEQLEEIIEACSNVGWENEDYTSGVAALKNALGVQPKTNAQIACWLLEKVYDDLEAHSAIICEPNVDHIQKLVCDAMQLLTKGDVK
jgi:hypothetical protein